MTRPAQRPGPDSTLDNLSDKPVEAGARLLHEYGAEVGLTNITLRDVVAEVGVSRSMSYRSLRTRTSHPNWPFPAVHAKKERLHCDPSFGAGPTPASPTSSNQQNITELFSSLYGRLAEMFDCGMRAPFTLDQLTKEGASLIEGIAMRHGFNRQITMIKNSADPNWSLEDRSLFALSFTTLFTGMCRANNIETPFANLRRD